LSKKPNPIPSQDQRALLKNYHFISFYIKIYLSLVKKWASPTFSPKIYQNSLPFAPVSKVADPHHHHHHPTSIYAFPSANGLGMAATIKVAQLMGSKLVASKKYFSAISQRSLNIRHSLCGFPQFESLSLQQIFSRVSEKK
jgi:hypothetical protein